MPALLIDPFSSGFHYHRLLREFGVAYRAVRTRRALDSGLSTGEAVAFLLVDGATDANLGELVDFCRAEGIDSVITGAESGVPLAEAVKIELGFASPDFGDRGRRYWDKSLLYSVVGDAGVRVPRRIGLFTAADVAVGSPRAVLETAPYPVVVKPGVGAGSVGVQIVDSPDRAVEAIESIVAAPGFFGGEPPAAVVQEFVRGREYVIDTVSHRGRHHVVAVCTYDKHPSSRGTMVYDRLRWLDWRSAETAMLAGYALEVLNALHHREGSVHMEAIIDDRGPCLIDLGARPHGAGHPLKTHMLTGSSQLHSEAAVAAGRGLPAADGYRLSSHATIEFLSLDGPGTVRPDADPSAILRHGFVMAGDVPAVPGKSYPETHSLLDSEELGLVFISGSDDREVGENAARLRREFRSMLEERNHAN